MGAQTWQHLASNIAARRWSLAFQTYAAQAVGYNQQNSPSAINALHQEQVVASSVEDASHANRITTTNDISKESHSDIYITGDVKQMLSK